MYKKIMVPLDGSELAECVLPHVEAFIRGFNIDHVTLMRVVEPERNYGGEYAIDPNVVTGRESARQSSARDYLNQIAARYAKEDTTFQIEVMFGRVAESLAVYAESNGIDLILIATHGRSGVTRWVRGSVADKILRSSNLPVLMVRAPGTEKGI
ncbi:MAG: universal stress protein [Deltaproteobacteria bacterium]|nr:universal stress protein [Deltaproteobacteria bacterium]